MESFLNGSESSKYDQEFHITPSNLNAICVELMQFLSSQLFHRAYFIPLKELFI